MSNSLSAERAKLLGAIGGLTTAATTDAKVRTQPARDARFKQFLDQVDPNQQLDEDERNRRALAAQRAHMARMRLRAYDVLQKRAADQLAVAEREAAEGMVQP